MSQSFGKSSDLEASSEGMKPYKFNSSFENINDKK